MNTKGKGYHLRYSIILRDLGQDDLAYTHAKKAVEIDNNFIDAVLHLASIEVNKRNLQSARDLIQKLPEKLSANQRLIKATVEAEIATREKNFDIARNIINKYQNRIDSYVMDVRARIEYYDAFYDFSSKKLILAKEKIQKAENIIQEAIRHFPNIIPLKTTHTKIQQLKMQIEDEID